MFMKKYAKVLVINTIQMSFSSIPVERGSEKYILNFIQAAMLDENRSCLLILGQKFCHSKEKCQIPVGLDCLDLPDLFDSSVAQEVQDGLIPEIVVRVMENFAPTARVFLAFCPFCVSLMKAYPKYFEERQLIYFYFCNGYYILDSVVYEDGAHYRFLYDYKHHIDYVVSDHHANLEQLEKKIPLYRGRVQTLYTCSRITDFSMQHQDGSRRLIWASRLDSQKRPDLLRKISQALCADSVAVDIHVYGSSVLDSLDSEYFKDCPNILYMGAFSGLESIPVTDKDAFLYTSLFDGLPNVLLEAAQMNIPVITVDVGGIPELVCDQSGFVVRNCADDVELVRRYVEKIKDFLGASERELQKKSSACGSLSRASMHRYFMKAMFLRFTLVWKNRA